MRKTPFITNGYYHVYNRGVDKRVVFLRFGHYLRFTNTIRTILNTGSATPRLIYNQGLALKLKIKILAYCLMPNHYHLLVQQTADYGISEFMHKLDTSYTMYFNRNHHRTGRLFEQTFKAKRIETDEVLLHVSRYIHLNPVVKDLIKHPGEWRWSSYQGYIDPTANTFYDRQQILGYFSTPDKYQIFVENSTINMQKISQDKITEDEDTLYL